MRRGNVLVIFHGEAPAARRDLSAGETDAHGRPSPRVAARRMREYPAECCYLPVRLQPALGALPAGG